MAFSLKLFGGASIDGRDGPLTGAAAQRHRLALLALLATTHPRAVSREKLMGCLWPERDTGHARRLLNQAVHTLRKTFGEEVILSAGDELRLGSHVLTADVIAFEEALASDGAGGAVGLYSGPFLDGFFLRDAPEFEQWVDRERERLAGSYARALEALAQAAELEGESPGAAEWWKARAVHDPYDSRVALRLMQALEASGNRAGALQHAVLHERLLREDLGIEPNPEVAALAERLRRDRGQRIEPEVERRDEAAKDAADAVTLPTRRSGSLPVGSAAASPSEATYTTTWFESDRLPTAGPAGMRRHAAWPARRWGTALALLGLGGLVILLAAFWLRQQGTPTLHPQRVVVAPFENRTGDPALDPLGSMAADWITQGLSQTAIVEVVPASAALVSARRVQAAVGETSDLDPVRALAEETGAGLVISGAYYQAGDSLQFQAQITDARERRLLRALEPVGGAVAAPTAAIERLRQRTLAVLAPLLDTRLGAHARLASQPPSYEAYQAYAEGMEHLIAGDFGRSIEPLERAVALDSTYLLPQLVIGVAQFNLNAPAVADSIVRALSSSRERLAPYDRAMLDLLTSWLRDDPLARYEAARRAATLAPGSLSHVQWGLEALRLNRPREAIRILSQIDPARGEVRGWVSYWAALTEAHHLLGEHRRELREARRAKALHPDHPSLVWLEARALVALGRLAELEQVVAQRMALPDDPAYGHPGMLAHAHPVLLMRLVGNELRVHGYPAAATQIYERAIAWHRARPADEQAGYRAPFGYTLLAAGQRREAEALFRELAGEDSAHIGFQGALGVLAAQRGDRSEAERISAWLAAQRHPHLRGMHSYWRACIAAHLERKAEATALLREAFGQSFPYGFFPHMSPFLEPLWDYPPFQELLRPKG